MFVWEFARIVIALQVFASGINLPKKYVVRNWKSVGMLLGPITITMWLITAGLIYGIVNNLTFLEALAIAACVTPTDPILANSIVKGKFADKYVPVHVRNIISAES